MAKENILSFYDYIENDPKVNKKMEKIKDLKESDPEKFSKKASKIAQKVGFEFTSNELLNYLNKKKTSIQKENEKLVAGGRAKKEDFSKGELAAVKVAKRAIINDATDTANVFHKDTYKD